MEEGMVKWFSNHMPVCGGTPNGALHLWLRTTVRPVR